MRSRRDGLRRRWLLDALAAQTLAPAAVVLGDTAARPAAVIDDGCRPEPRWLEELVAAAARAPGRPVRGRTVPDPLDASPVAGSLDANVLWPLNGVAGAEAVSAPEAIVHAARPSRRSLRLPPHARAPRPVPDRMRVALLNPWFWPEVRRGSERLLHDLAVDLTALGHAPRLLTSHPSTTTRTIGDGFAVVRTRRPPAGLLERHGVQEALSHVPLTLAELLRGNDDAAVAAYLTDALAAVAWGARTGRPAVYAYMGIPERHVLASRRGRLALLETVTARADAVVALSTAARDAIWRWLGVEAHVIAPGVDLDHFTPQPAARAAEPTIACAADPGEGRKRVEAIVTAFAHVRRERPTARLRLMKPRDPAVQRRLAAPGVEFADLASEELRDLYRDAWVTGLASRQEAFGLVLVESLACGTPVFGRREGGVPDIVGSDAVGRLFDDEDELAGVMLETLELAQDPVTAGNCRRRAEAFSSRTCAEAYVELLKRL
ncbi:MAG: glycosyltransferase family 4 protein [Solirubrobacteraceae bacterium]